MADDGEDPLLLTGEDKFRANIPNYFQDFIGFQEGLNVFLLFLYTILWIPYEIDPNTIINNFNDLHISLYIKLASNICIIIGFIITMIILCRSDVDNFTVCLRKFGALFFLIAFVCEFISGILWTMEYCKYAEIDTYTINGLKNSECLADEFLLRGILDSFVILYITMLLLNKANIEIICCRGCTKYWRLLYLIVLLIVTIIVIIMFGNLEWNDYTFLFRLFIVIMGILTVTSIILGIIYGCGFGALQFERIFGILFIFWMCICVSSILIGFIYYFGYQSEWEDYLTSIGDVIILVSINIYTISEIFTRYHYIISYLHVYIPIIYYYLINIVIMNSVMIQYLRQMMNLWLLMLRYNNINIKFTQY